MEATRDYISVKANLTGRFRVLKDADEAPILYGGSDAASAVYHEEALRSAGFPEAVSKFLIGLDSKLNTIISMLRKEEIDTRFPHESQLYEISGGSIVFSCDETLEINTYLEVMICLEEMPARLVSSVGRISEVRLIPGGRTYLMEFTNITDADQDHIVQYVFQVERRTLRERHR